MAPSQIRRRPGIAVVSHNPFSQVLPRSSYTREGHQRNPSCLPRCSSWWDRGSHRVLRSIADGLLSELPSRRRRGLTGCPPRAVPSGPQSHGTARPPHDAGPPGGPGRQPTSRRANSSTCETLFGRCDGVDTYTSTHLQCNPSNLILSKMINYSTCVCKHR